MTNLPHYSSLGRMTLCGKEVRPRNAKALPTTDDMALVGCPDCKRRWQIREDLIRAQKAK